MLRSANWQTRLPARRDAGPDPDGFMPGAEVADMLETYARLVPARTVLGVELPGLGWRVGPPPATTAAPRSSSRPSQRGRPIRRDAACGEVRRGAVGE